MPFGAGASMRTATLVDHGGRIDHGTMSVTPCAKVSLTTQIGSNRHSHFSL
jgi:hypothetical protein